MPLALSAFILVNQPFLVCPIRQPATLLPVPVRARRSRLHLHQTLHFTLWTPGV
jgi:hypothetical protein